MQTEGNMKFWKREPTEKTAKKETNVLQMVTTTGELHYAWNGKLYESDIVRACIRPKVKAIGKLTGKHIRDDPAGGLKVNPDANIRFLLSFTIIFQDKSLTVLQKD